MKKFLNKDQIKINKSGYLTDLEGSPISNTVFEDIQEKAAYIIELAEHIKDKDFVGKKADSKTEVVVNFTKEFYKDEKLYNETLIAPKTKLTDSLKKEALDFISFKEEVKTNENINHRLSEFKDLKVFEDFGLFFEEGICKIKKIYTFEEVIEALKKTLVLV